MRQSRPFIVGIFLALPIVIIIGCAGPITTPNPTSVLPETVIAFPDANLETAIREALGKPPDGKITAAELDKLTELCTSETNITDISGLEYCTSLTLLALSGNQISDISPLSSLTNLTSLSLSRVQISDISPLSSLTNLTKLLLGGNQISDVSPLSSLTNLTELYIYRNQIVDLSPLSSLSNLTRIDLRHNQISDISPLSSLTNLMWLDLSGNQISDISPLLNNSGLGLEDDLWLKENNLDLQVGSEAMEDIRALEERGAMVHLHDEPSR